MVSVDDVDVVFCFVGLLDPPVLLTAVVTELLFVFGGLPGFVPGNVPGGDWPELLPEKPELCAFWSALLPVPPVPDLLLPPSSAPMRAFRPPGGNRLGRLGDAPVLTITNEFARVMVCVWPWPVTVMLLPNRKAAVVLPEPTPKIPMPPRMPMVPDGVLIVTGLVLLILPPTKRNTPWLAVTASSPVLVLGS